MTDAARLLIDHVETPLGPFTLVADPQGRLHASGWIDDQTDGRMQRLLRAHATDPRLTVTRAHNPGGLTDAIAAYFAGDLAAIAALTVAPAAGTPFQRLVWGALREIPCGQTRSYGEIARRIGKPAAVRAVGLANGANPIGVVVPCHRVIGSTGALVGYGGGVERKRWLLAHERPRATATMGNHTDTSRQISWWT
jgi:methylated-DNA-[protein]-cysteine S-methyltransferase